MLELYENIRKYRIERRMSQAELAKKTGYGDRSSIAKIERGDVDLPQSKIILFAKALSVTPGDLMGDVENGYYIDPDAKDLANFLKEHPEHKVLFDASRKVKKEDIERALRAVGIFIDE